ncbi:TRADD-N-associated membrane domain-containing protein [Bacillus subtilis]|uniref:TRADD-N-associated membrane domain-containing protein n=1 Tax=Bacillus subtilis TaxID=1423 RepID=UPI0039E08D61
MDKFEKEIKNELKNNLTLSKVKLLQEKDNIKLFNRIYFIFGIAMALLAIVYIVLNRHDTFKLTFGTIGLIIGIVMTVYFSFPKHHREDLLITEIDNEISLLDSPESRSEMLFRQHHFDLNGYYELNLKQNKTVFKIGIMCIILGFVMIGVTFALLASDIFKGVQTKMIVGAIGALGAILSNFIAAIYLKMHTNTIKTMTEFHNRYVNTNRLYFSNYLISNIKDNKKREDTLATLALNLSKPYSRFDDEESN